MIIAVTGATGFVGQAVMDEAGSRGIAVRALTRRDQKPRQGVTWVRGDLHDASALAQLCEGVDGLLHIAGVVNVPDKAGFVRGNVEGTRNVLEAALGGAVQRFVCVSSLAAREPSLSDYGASKCEAEELVRASSIPWSVVRPPAVYGPRDTEMFELFRAARKGIIPMPPAGGRASIIHVKDLARLLLDLVLAGEFSGSSIYEPDDGKERGWAHNDLAQAIGTAIGRKVWSPAIPAWLIRAGATFDGVVRGKKAKLTADRASYICHPNWVSNPQKSVPEALWKAEIPTEIGLRETANWYQENSWF